MTTIIIIVAVLAVAYLLYLGVTKRREQRLEAERERKKLGEKADGHRSIADDHQSKADDLAEAAGVEKQRADRHQERAAEVDPEVETADR